MVLKGVHISSPPGRITTALAPALRHRVVSPSSAHSYSTYSPLFFSSPASTSAACRSPSRATHTSVSAPDNLIIVDSGSVTVQHPIHPDPEPHQPPSPSPSPLPGIPSYPHRRPQQQLHSAFPSHSSVTSSLSDLSPEASLPFTKAASSLFSSAQLFISSLPHSFVSTTPERPMASAPYPYSSSSSDISTPRSSSPSPSTGRSSHTSISKRTSLSLARRTSNFNPMSSIDLQAIEEAMRAQQLDQLRGYRKDTYGEVKQTREPVYVSELTKRAANGIQVLSEPTFNKGNTRSFLLLNGFLLPCVLMMLISHPRSCFHA